MKIYFDRMACLNQKINVSLKYSAYMKFYPGEFALPSAIHKDITRVFLGAEGFVIRELGVKHTGKYTMNITQRETSPLPFYSTTICSIKIYDAIWCGKTNLLFLKREVYED